MEGKIVTIVLELKGDYTIKMIEEGLGNILLEDEDVKIISIKEED